MENNLTQTPTPQPAEDVLAILTKILHEVKRIADMTTAAKTSTVTPSEWESYPLATKWRPVVAVAFLRETHRWPTVTQRNLAECVRKKKLRNFGSKQRPLYSKQSLISMLERLTDDSIIHKANGSFSIDMSSIGRGRAA